MLRLVAIVSLKCAYLEISISGNYIDNFGLCKFGFTYAAVIPPSLYGHLPLLAFLSSAVSCAF